MTRRRPARRGAATRAVTALLVTVGVLAAAVLAVVAVLDRADAARPVTQVCTVELDGTTWRLSPEQADNAALIAAVAVQRQLPARAVTIALATALQESKLVNIDYGDRDSVGLFQQRESQGWGTVEQIMDPVYSTGKFYDALVAVAGYQELPVTEAAQAVQRSGYPDAYAQHELRARAWASALTGWSPSSLACSLRDADGAGSPDGFAARVARDLGALAPAVAAAPNGADGSDADPVVLDVDARALAAGSTDTDAEARASWTLAQWSVAVATDQHLTAVDVLDQRWTRATGTWEPSDSPVPAGTVRVTLAG